MARKTKHVECMVLGKTKLAEQDLILTMLATDGSQIRAVAKGARKPGSRLAARTELFCQTKMLLSYGRGLPIVTDAEIVQSHKLLRGNIDMLALGSMLLEVARLTSYEDMDDPFLFGVLARALAAVEQNESMEHRELFVAAYVIKVMSHCGWRPVLDGCVACGETPATRFSVDAGGLLCESCAKDVAGAVPMSSDAAAWIQALVGYTFDELERCTIDANTSDYLIEIAHVWAARHLDARLRAFEYYRGA
ncbi:MAG: DNA repair protein RecO [Atopobiaceae bacterium]|nr:DNA repair protein RecO [Atopobiaceae bacterium]